MQIQRANRFASALTHKKGNFGGVVRKSLPHNLGNRKWSLPDYGKTMKAGVPEGNTEAIQTGRQEGKAVNTR